MTTMQRRETESMPQRCRRRGPSDTGEPVRPTILPQTFTAKTCAMRTTISQFLGPVLLLALSTCMVRAAELPPIDRLQ